MAPQSTVTPNDTDLALFRLRFRAWLRDAAPSLPQPDNEPDLAGRIGALRKLQAVLYSEGWAQWGWPVELGGIGGDARHRAVIYDELAINGWVTRSAYEHIEILAPALLPHWSLECGREMLPQLLRGDQVWSQGFSEPDAGSDLASIRTRARRDGDDYRITGRKIWTSWAAYADQCVVLARTGSVDARHRGLSAFFVDLEAEGVEVSAVRQANGVDELAEITFEDVLVSGNRLVGEEGGGWSFALDVLSCERSAFAWLRQTRLYAMADKIIAEGGDARTAQFGDTLLDLFALRAASAQAVNELAAGHFLGPAAAPVKLLLTAAEQGLYDVAQVALGSGLVLGSIDSAEAWQEDFLFSRAVSIYGGTRQIQLTTIARFLLGLTEEKR